MDGTDVCVVEGGGETCFAEKARAGRAVAGKARIEQFQRHAAAQPDILGQINFTHPTRAELLLDEVMTNLVSDERIGIRVFE